MTVPVVMHSRKGFNSFSDFSKFLQGTDKNVSWVV